MKFCTKCGSQLEDNASFCTACGAPVEQEANMQAEENSSANYAQQSADVQEAGYVAEDNSQSGEYQQASGFDDVAADGVAAPKMSKLKKRLIAIITAFCLLVTSGVLAFFFSSVFRNFTVKVFASPSDYLGYVVKENLKKVEIPSDIFNSTYDLNLKLTVDEAAADFVSEAEDYLDDDFSDIIPDIVESIEDIEISGSLTLKETQLGMTAVGNVNGKKIAETNLSADFDEEEAYFDLGDLSEDVLYMDASEFANVYKGMAKLFGSVNKNDKTIKKLTEKYAKIVLSDLDVKKSKKKLETETLSKKYTALSFTLKEKTALKISKDILKSALNDEELQKMIIDLFNSVEPDEKLTKSKLKKQIKEALEEVEERLEDGDFSDGEVEFTIYVDGGANIKGVNVTVTDDDEEWDAVRYAAIEKGNKFEEQLEIFGEPDRELMTIYGSGKIKGKTRTGDYEVSTYIDGELTPIEIISFEDWSSKPAGGRMSFRYTEDYYKQTTGYRYTGDYDLVQFLDNLTYYVEVEKANKTEYVAKCGLQYDDADVLVLDINAAKKKADKKIKFPEECIEDEDEWGEGINEQKLFTRLKSAGVKISILDLMY